MSIPKEPRQLMINLMYLVLTALLALNVSAEVMNAFFSLDKGLKNSRSIVERNNDQLLQGINKQADAYKNPNNEKYRENAKKALQITADFSAYIDAVRDTLFEVAKGPSKDDPSIPKDIRNKDVTTRIFINEGMGFRIQDRIEKTRAELLALADDNSAVAAALPLVLDSLPPNTKMNSWAEFKFKQMPVAAVFPILGKIQSDAKNSATAVLNYCAEKVGGTEIKFDAFQPAISAEKSYVISGDRYAADVFLSAYSTQADNISINVGGSSLPIKDGVARYEVGTSGVGERSYNVSINVKNPLTGELKNYSKEFKYEVGQRSVAVSLDKMNVFYIGVDNPISVSAAGVSSNDVKVVGNGGGISVTSNGGGGKYIVRVTNPGEATLTVSGGGASQTFNYRVKRIPDPTPLLGAQHRSKAMGNGEFKAQSGIAAVLENFDFEAKCEVVGFEATYLKKRQDPSPEIPNAGPRFNEKVLSFVRSAGPGDQYFFDNIKARCPGDAQPRNLGGLAFKIR